jgi:hypothetical protein
VDSSVDRQKGKNNNTEKKEERGQTEMKDWWKEKVENNKDTDKL